ncbi:hypothetical protein BsIDN1_25010 [Bacillus safensis]|uniref:Uncharacterized protein n=1 Tax=Bacillus safensis TaxID=561879 RepID=A0A5S9M6Y8_BACIA|nr:hypothetical protein BsIDN1_25010 [Bacillus safensis]
MEQSAKTSKIAFLSVLSNTFVVILKIIVGLLTGSVAVLLSSPFIRFSI